MGRPRLIANFVSTIDGVVAIPSVPRSSQLIADGDDDDRFVMALLRAVSDVIVIGSGTLHASPNSLWTPSRPYPEAQASFAELRRRLKLSASPDLAVLTGSGDTRRYRIPHSSVVRSFSLRTEERANFEDGCLLRARLSQRARGRLST